MNKEFDWPFEISGFGGGYEQACRDMTKTGVLWLHKHPEELAKWRQASREYRERTGKNCTPQHVYPPSYKEFEEAFLKVCNDCTITMYGASKSHAIAIFEYGWDGYVKKVIDARNESEVENG